MKKQSILLLSPFFHPEQISTGKYNTYLAKELVTRECEVVAVASHPLYPDWRPRKSDAVLHGVKVVRGGVWMRYPSSALLRRALLEMWYAWHVFFTYVRRHQTPDLVVPVFPPSFFFLLLSAIVPTGCRKIGVIHDLQGVHAARSRRIVGRIINRIIHFVEKHCFSSCDKLIFLSKSMRQRAILEYGLDAEKCVVCYPFVALEKGKSPAEGKSLASLFTPDKLSIVYSGALGDKQNPDGLCAFLQELGSVRSGVECHIFSSGPHFERLRAVYDKGASSIKFHDLVAMEDLDELYARSDVQVIPQAPGTMEGSLPSKLPNLMAAGVPVFVICEKGSELADLVREANAGHVSYTWDPDALVEEFSRLVPMLGEETRSERQIRLRSYMHRRFNVQNVAEEILNV